MEDIMRLFGLVRLALASVLAMVVTSDAEANILWLASNGSGTVCTQANPCGTLGQAISSALPGDEIRCVDGISISGSSFSITKSLAINCEDHPISVCCGG